MPEETTTLGFHWRDAVDLPPNPGVRVLAFGQGLIRIAEYHGSCWMRDDATNSEVTGITHWTFLPPDPLAVALGRVERATQDVERARALRSGAESRYQMQVQRLQKLREDLT